jgi:hypothetical protein
MRELFGDAAERTRGARRGWAEHLVLLGGIQRAAGAVEAAAVSFRDAFDTASAVECEDARRAAAQGLAELAAAQGDPVAENRWRAAAR